MLYKKNLKEIPPTCLDEVRQGKCGYVGVSKIVIDEKCGKLIVADISSTKPLELRYRFFSDGHTYQVYNVEADKWSQCMVSSAISGVPGGSYHYRDETERVAMTLKTEKMIKKFLDGTYYSYGDLAECLDEFISKIEREKRMRAYDRKMERIEAHMSMFPEMPEDFRTYLKENLSGNYIFTTKLEKGKKPGVCTNCGKKVRLDKGTRHRSITVCPKCGARVTAFERRHIDATHEKKRVCMAHKVNGRLIIRWMNVQMGWYESKDRKCEFWYRADDYFRTLYLFEKGKSVILNYEYKSIYPYGAEWRRKDYTADDLSYIYTNNLTEVFGKKYYNVDFKEELNKGTQPLRFVQLLDNLKNLPPTEYLVKMGMYRLASELHESLLKGRDFKSILGINPQYKKLYSDKNVSLEEHEMIKAAHEWVTEEDFMKMRQLHPNSYQVSIICEMLDTMTYKRLVNYFSKQRKKYKRITLQQLLTWYKDYISMSEQLNVDLSHKSVKFPSDLKEAHDRLLSEYKSVESDIKDRQLKEATVRLYSGLTEYKSNGYAIVFPRTQRDFIVEGQSLNHCVGTQEKYFLNHLEGKRMILFIRHEEEIDKPFVTMEIDMESMVIMQIYGYGDKKPAIDVINFANKFLRQLKGSKEVSRRSA